MKVSVIIPFHKGVFFLEDALQSLKEQKYKDFEILLICDHAEESLETILTPYREGLDIKIYDLEEKSGVAAARNAGLSLAAGEYVYFLDSDDFIQSNTLELLVSAAERDNADLVYGKMIWTWFKRSTFLAHQDKLKEEPEAEDESAEDESAEEEDNLNSSDLELENNFQLKDEIREKVDNRIEVNQRTSVCRDIVSAKKGVRNITVLHILIKRAFLMDKKIRFKEELRYLSDYPFVLQLLQHAESFNHEPDALYMKRNHNDSVHFPSLHQLPESKSFKEYVEAYQYAAGLVSKDEDLKERLDQKILHYYSGYFAPKLRRSKNKEVLNEQFEMMYQLASDMDRKLFHRQNRYKRHLYQALVEGNYKKSIRLVNSHLAWKRLKRITRNRRALSKFLYVHLFLKKSVKENWVFCESFFGKNYSDSPKYIYEYISENHPGRYRFVWVIDKKNTKIPYRHTKVRRFSIRYCYYLARCKYYIFNGRQPEWVRKRKGNVFLQTWHGTPLKRLVFDLEDISSATSHYKKQTYKQSRSWDFLIAANQYSSDIFRRCFLYEKTMLETGYPRNDILHNKDKELLADRVKKRLGIPKEKKTILYAPTWRDDEYYTKGRYKFELQLDLRLMKEMLGQDYVILLRTHYFIADHLNVTGLEDFAYNLSKYDDIAELYLISDILITDYSSVFFDYANLKRPMLFFMYDLEKYRDILRGFYINIQEELPGPILSTSEEVVHAIQTVEKLEQDYRDKYTAFYHKYCAWEDGSASKKVAEAVFHLTENTR